MTKNKTIVFDFDGTIVDIIAMKKIFLDVFNDLSDEIGSRRTTLTELDKIRDLEIIDLLREFKIPIQKLPVFVSKFKQASKENAEKLTVFPGMKRIIKKLSIDNHLGILTSNDKPHVETFLIKHQLSDCFSFIYSGKNIFGKSEVMKKMIKEKKIDKSLIFYIGDESRDVRASQKIGIKSVAVTWGLNSRVLLEKQNPDFLIDSPEQLLELC